MDFDRLVEEGAADAGRAQPIFRIRAASAKADLSNAPDGLAALAELNGFTGESGTVLVNEDGAVLGVGEDLDPFVAAAAAERLPEGVYRFAGGAANAAANAAAALGWLMGGYRFDAYRQAKPAPKAKLLAPVGVDVAAIQRIAAALTLARNLVSTPASDMGPDKLAAAAGEVAERFGADYSVVEGDDLLARNFPLIHAVGRASAIAPRLIDFTWGDPSRPKLTLIGKGVTFDTGGLNLKSGSGMALMKKDMGGAANVLALAQMVMDARLPVRLRVLIPAVENAVSGSAFRPGDVLKSRKGLTIEIGNTDAEGRLVLADALALAGEEDPATTITLATLTGAARVALGPDLPPFYCDDETFAGAVAGAAAKVFDPVWRMPLWKPYANNLSSQVADLCNITSDSFAGSVTAALFLQRFAPESGVWAHFDIYAWRPKAAPGRPVGGEAQAIRALFEALASRFDA